MLSTKSMLHTGAAAVVAGLLTAVSLAPVAAAADRSDDRANRPAAAKANHEHTHKRAGNGERPEGRRGGDRTAKGRTSNEGKGAERGNGHTPVTVCHLLGNGSYNLLTFDENALGAHEAHGDIYPVPADGCPEGGAADGPSNGADEDNGEGHTPVTVCHVLGNGGYIELTFDDDALSAHQAHGDLYPMPADGCPVSDETDEGTTPGADDEGTTPGVTDEAPLVPGAEPTAEVLGVEQLADDTATDATQVAGVDQVAAANRAAVSTGPLAGVLPNTGAVPMGLAAVAGLTLLGAGATVLVRRRALVS